jgi:outer membrane protein
MPVPHRRHADIRSSRRGSGRWTPAALAMGLALAFPGVRAQSLQQLYDQARSFDATYLAARALADSALYRAEQVHALRRPGVALTGVAQRTGTDNVSTDNSARSATATLGATQTLFNRANDATISQADKGVESAKSDVLLAEQDLIVRLTQAYFDVLTAQETLASAQANRRAISEQLASAKRNFEVGTATITDTREAQARFDLATAQELQADNDLTTKKLALDTVVGRTGVNPKPIEAPTELPSIAIGSIDEWLAPIDTSPGVARARIGLDVAQLETEKARAGHLPTVDLSGGITRGHAQSDGTNVVTGVGNVPFDVSGRANGTNVAVTLRVPIFSGFAVQNRVKETLLLEEQARENYESARRTSVQATRTAFFTLQSLQSQVRAFEAAESSSQLSLEATQLGYKVGVRVNLDVLNAQTQLYNAKRDLAKARNDVVVAAFRLRQAAGTLGPEDVQKADRLLAK